MYVKICLKSPKDLLIRHETYVDISIQLFSGSVSPEQSLSGFEQGHTGMRIESPRVAVCPSHYSFQGWQDPSTLFFPISSIFL
ncbi:hypothetical protein EVAR_10136_1 [Eumeta japonica]|uniref:Uncharacterized protein n=1 Tax=Eumeta variegata TaxID=151549 RepID=A0A4C1UC54_EUMVA|nr:hypothetical protein EVAR_10136_1 [Eumeta japonica]